MAFAGDDPVEPAKLLQKFIDDGGKLSIKTGLVDGQVLTPEAVGELAKLPSRDELIGKLVGTVNAPLYGLAAVLNGLLRNLVGVLGAIEKEKSGGADAAGE
jgi:large subunit ribosomal protein L10